MIKNYPHTCAFLLLSVLLGIPFALRTIVPALEVYPSIVLPARATTVSISSPNITYTKIELFGIKDGEQVRLDPIHYLDPIPVQNLGVLFERSFTIDPKRSQSLYFKYLPIPKQEFIRNNITLEEQTETKDWLRHKLSEQGCDTNTLILRQSSYLAERSTSKIIDFKILNEQILELN